MSGEHGFARSFQGGLAVTSFAFAGAVVDHISMQLPVVPGLILSAVANAVIIASVCGKLESIGAPASDYVALGAFISVQQGLFKRSLETTGVLLETVLPKPKRDPLKLASLSNKNENPKKSPVQSRSTGTAKPAINSKESPKQETEISGLPW